VSAIDLVVTDLDGTLWHSSTEVALHPDTMAAIDELRRRDVGLLVATGRRLASTRSALARHGLRPPVVVLNGAMVVDLATDERIHLQAFRPDDAVEVLHHFLDAGVSPCVYVEQAEVDVFVGATPSTHPEHRRSFGEWARPADLEEVVRTEAILAFGVISVPEGAVADVYARVGGIANAHLSDERGYSGGVTLTVAPPDLSKWDGVVAFCAARGYDPTRVLAIGDGPNDLELLDGAAVAVVMEDGHPEALARADHLVRPAVDGGWAGLLDHLG
jgi:hydroxymethylpyrimidine pyrophosphatase-like HAD family hydrolase